MARRGRVSMRPDRAFSFRRTMPGNRPAFGLPGRGRLVHCWVNHLASLPRLLGGLLGILGILSRKAIGGGGTQVTSRRHTVLEPGVG